MTIPVPQGIRGRDLAVDIKKKGLKAGLKGKDPIVQGELTKEIKVDDSTWTLGEPPLFRRFQFRVRYIGDDI